MRRRDFILELLLQQQVLQLYLIYGAVKKMKNAQRPTHKLILII